MTDQEFRACDLVELLKERFPRPGYMLAEQVAPRPGFVYPPTFVDVVVASMWETNGRWIAAFEIKVNRQDFRNEIRNPEKNRAARERNEEFWYVTPKDVADPQEIPEGVGLLHAYRGPKKTGLRIVKQAVRRASGGDCERFMGFLQAALRPITNLERGVQLAMRNEIIAEAAQKFLRGGGIELPYNRGPEAWVEAFEKAASRNGGRS